MKTKQSWLTCSNISSKLPGNRDKYYWFLNSEFAQWIKKSVISSLEQTLGNNKDNTIKN